MSESNNEKTVHEDVFRLLPWYYNGTLSEVERSRVEPHLAECSECQDEFLRCSEVDEVVSPERESDWQPTTSDLDRVLERIVSLEPVPPRRRRARAGMPAFWPLLPSPARWALAGQSLLIAGLALLLLWPEASDPRGATDAPPALFETLTDPPELTSPGEIEGHRIEIVFAEGVTESELRSLLQSVGGSIVAGPSRRGVYALVLKGRNDFDSEVQRLRDDPRVRFAEILTRAARP